MRIPFRKGGLLACAIAAGIGTASAGPEECLTLRDNVAVAGCANKYAPATTARSAATPAPGPRAAPRQPIQAAEKWLLFPVPSPLSQRVVATSEPPDIIAARDRSELIRRAEVGGVALVGVGLVFGLWRWRASMIKTCGFCGTRVVPGSAVCRKCFRAV